MKRYDYRNDFKDMNLDQLQSALSAWKNRLLDAINTSGNIEYASKRVDYIETRIEKLQGAI